MSDSALDSLLEKAFALHRAGKTSEAKAIYQEILSREPHHADALHMLGVLSMQSKNATAAIDFFSRAIAIDPRRAHFHANLGMALGALGRFDDAIESFRRALSGLPHDAELQFQLGRTLINAKKSAQAIGPLERAIALRTGHAMSHFNLASALAENGRVDDAIAQLRLGISIQPEIPEAMFQLAGLLKNRGQLDESIQWFARALQLRPNFAEGFSNLGNAIESRGNHEEAIRAFRRALEIQPDMVEVYNNLGVSLKRMDRLEEAIDAYRKLVAIKPDFPNVHVNLGNALKLVGRFDDAIACYRRALELQLDDAQAHSNLLYILHFSPKMDAKSLLVEHQKWNEIHARRVRAGAEILPHSNVRERDRRLKIGYVSPDFREHVVGWNLLPVLEQHDRQQFEIVCYSNGAQGDAMTDLIKACANVWRNIVGLGDQQVAEMIRADGIDILIDLSLHSADNRLLTFALKPAPVQISYLGYCSTTGVSEIDYRLSDPYIDPVDSDVGVYSEETIRLPRTYWCYRPGATMPDVKPPPVLASDSITFGCLNNLAKLSDPAIDAFARILNRVAKSRLILFAPAGSHRQLIQEKFAVHNIAPDRIEFVAKQSPTDYAATYHRVDIALDPFPYGGGITTCDALFMGVPVVTLIGKTSVGRGGRSILSNVGLVDLIADSVEKYVDITTKLAADQSRLIDLRHSLRARMTSSPLMDYAGFARDLENVYRDLWRQWCDSQA